MYKKNSILFRGFIILKKISTENMFKLVKNVSDEFWIKKRFGVKIIFFSISVIFSWTR